jgi:hypothetical protein
MFVISETSNPELYGSKIDVSHRLLSIGPRLEGRQNKVFRDVALLMPPFARSVNHSVSADE